MSEHGLLQARVSAVARARGQAGAVVMGDQRLSYAELDDLSDRIALMLLERGIRPGERVLLMQAKTPTAIASMLGVLKAGGVYVPIDIRNPPRRAQRIIDRAEAHFVLADEQAAAQLAGVTLSAQIGAVAGGLAGADFGPELPASGEAPKSAERRPQDAAHLMFTSGSTGEAKGVIVTHAMVGAFLSWALAHFGHRSDDRISSHPPLHFDLSTFDVFGALCSGAELHLTPPHTLLPRQLADFIRDSQLTQWFSVPSAFSYMARGGALAEPDFPSLRRVIWCGEVMPPAVLAHWMRRVPHASFTNLYGPTETTIASSFHTVEQQPPPELAVPIGRPCTGEQITVHDDQGKRLADGESGELQIAGVGLSPGYWGDPEATRAAFISDPDSGQRRYRTGDLGRRDADGLLHYAGRLDQQVKSRGYRIELGEIETVASGLAGVAECAVVAIPSSGFESSTICCAWTPAAGGAADTLTVRAALAERLPGYMLPSRWLVLEELPRGASGKIDRRAIAARFSEQARG